MLSTSVLIVTAVVTVVVGLAVWAVCLGVGLRWAKAERRASGRVVLAAILVSVVQLLLAIAMLAAASGPPLLAFAAIGLYFAGWFLTPWIVIRVLFRLPWARSIQAWLPTLLTIPISLLMSVAVKSLIVEAFVMPTNPMAPTLLGNHVRAVCTECGEPCYASLPGPYPGEEPPRLICSRFHVTQPSLSESTLHSPDRFLVAKYLRPRRWDLVVFQYPENPTQFYCMRLVGLPNEKIEIKDGAVWANGKKLIAPSELVGLEYLSEYPDGYPEVWGSSETPALLNDDEYYVLGDFSHQSSDSRFWHAVPGRNMTAVVTHIYWPPKRWRVIR